MEVVGVRKLKENLSRYLKRVKSGERILITDRKRKVAIIVPCERETDEENALQLIQRGLAHWTGGKPTGMASRIASKGRSVSEAVLEDRR
ncbi:MAG: type II toxin-antitoxin system prevent-host-death family antitoxin [Proteobacteria bacterium]|nr:type II toxin-antitoxin system prevent-host-death family antitoxin [Pseudomonadota bacterium]